ncbi:hypothetical protein [Clostridium sp. DJ247]|uniref:hypothetical protein n=1 Tax=Clostridium sp. DJ247 TaxID=2726188 RepID=UPI001627D28A|nr:hypothetical protein [Clostridium sp. DJ247]MBC2578968.1 hypothetical protein [Clostridium sp. DJ247]
MFNYYNRIAKYALDLELNGNIKKAEQLREILKKENRCTLCGGIKINESGFWKCIWCTDRLKVVDK